MLESYFVFGDIPSNAETGEYYILRVLVSYWVATFASYIAFLLASELAQAENPLERRALHWGGALAFGTGVWSMHFIGMLSYKTSIVLEFDPWITFLSWLIAVAAAYGIFALLSQERLSARQIFGGGLLIGVGSSAMHYIGMAALQMDGELRHLPGLFFASIGLAILISWAALWIGFTLARRDDPTRALFQFVAALILGVAIWGMHYVGMEAAIFLPVPGTPRDPFQTFHLLPTVTTVATGVVLLIAQAIVAYRGARAECRLRDSESKLRAVIDHALDALITIDSRGIVVSFNPAAERIFGYQAAEVIGRNVKMLMPDPYRAEHDGYLARYLLTGEPRIIGTTGREVSAMRKDGTVFPIDLSVSAFTLMEGSHFAGTVRDIADRKKAEWQLQQSIRRVQSIIEGALDAIITIDDQGRITEWNTQAENIFGWSREEALGRLAAELIVPEAHRGADQAGMEPFLNTGRLGILNQRKEMQAQRCDGTVFLVEMAVTAQEVDNHYTFTAFMRDISAQKRAEEERDANIRALEASNRELDEFAYIVSHDLKEPLRGLRNQATFLAEDFADKLGEDGLKRLQRMSALGDRMQQLIDELLFYSRLGRGELAVQPTDPNAIVRDVATMLESFIADRHAAISVPQPMPVVLCDKVRLAEVFRNLITNGLKYNDKLEPRVEVGFLPEAAGPQGREREVFYVKDNGVGIPPEFHDEIFRMFKRLNNAAAGDPAGTGAGLTFVKKIVERHRGRIWLESTPGEGTTFYFTLPQPLAGMAKPEPAPSEDDAARGHAAA
jgi:two-component system sensor kinase FixL